MSIYSGMVVQQTLTSPKAMSKFFNHKTVFLAAAAGAVVAGTNPAHAIMTGPVAITNPGAVLPSDPGSTNLNSIGFNASNFASVWALAPTGFVPKLIDVRLFTKGSLSGTFTATNTNTGASLNIPSNAVTFEEKSNNMTSSDQATTRTLTSGSNPLPAASISTTVVTTNTTTPYPPVASTPTSPACASGWQQGSSLGSPFNITIWNCTTTTTTVTPSTATFNISSNQNATNWSLIGSGDTYGVDTPFWSAPTVNIPSSIVLSFAGFTPTTKNANFTLNGSGSDNYLVYTYDYVNAQVPAPLPLAGAGLAFGFSRRLRLRIKSSATSAS
jgi:hypothetical protein